MPNPPSGGVLVMLSGASPAKPVQTGTPTTFGANAKLFHVKFQFQNPLTGSPQALLKGLLAYLYKGGELMNETGKGAELDGSGYVALKSGQKADKGNYHFVLRQAVRTYVDLDKGKSVSSEKVEENDKRNLLELPVELDTALNHFTHGSTPKLTQGVFKDYVGKGEGTAGAPILFTLNLYWYPVQIQFYNPLKHALEAVPAGLCLQARVNGKTYAENIGSFSHIGAFADVSTVSGYQKHLNVLGFDCGKVDGIDGPKTKKGVKAFQSAFGLKKDGLCGPKTQAKLKEIFYNRKTSVVKDNTYFLPVLKTSAPTPKIDFICIQTEAWLSLSDKKPAAFKDFTWKKYGELADLDKFQWYDLPETWISSGSQARVLGDMAKTKTADEAFQTLGCYPVGAKEIDNSRPLIYCLDDAILMADPVNPETWTANTRFALFDEDAVVVDPDLNEPYITKDAAKSVNYFAVKDKKILSVFALGKYYFPRMLRVPADKEGAGLRAAILNGVTEERVKEPMLSYTGNYHQFYCHAVKVDSGKLVSYILVSWLCNLKVHVSVTTPSELSKAQTGITNYKKSGMMNCKARHEAPKFIAEDKDGKSQQTIRIVKHFVVVDPALAYCEVSVHGGAGAARDNMGLTAASFNAANYVEQSPGGWFTAAHELGHAMGLHDDYMEPPAAWGNAGWQSPVVGRFAQWVKGSPFLSDSSSLMNVNETIRHRMAFHHIHWVNTDTTIRGQTGNRRFLLKNNEHQYYVPPADERGFASGDNKFYHYLSAFSEDAFTQATGKMDLMLYQMGLDKTQSVMVPTLKFDGVLVVCLYLKWSFTDGTDAWDLAKKQGQIKTMYSAIEAALNRKFYLKASDSTNFKNILILFRLYFHEGADSTENRLIIPWNPETHIQEHFNINCHRDPRNPSYHDEAFNGDSLDVAKGVGAVSLFRYMIGLKPMERKNASVTEINTVSASDLSGLRDWVEGKLASGKLGKGYQVKTI